VKHAVEHTLYATNTNRSCFQSVLSTASAYHAFHARCLVSSGFSGERGLIEIF